MTTAEKCARLEAVEKELDIVKELIGTPEGFHANWKRFADLSHEWAVLHRQIQKDFYGEDG